MSEISCELQRNDIRMTHYQSLMLKHRFIYVLIPIQQDSKWNSSWIGNVDVKKVVRKGMKKRRLAELDARLARI